MATFQHTWKPGQIRSARSIKRGHWYIKKHELYGDRLLLAITNVFVSTVDKHPYFFAVDAEGIVETCALADCGVISYESGVWNDVNTLFKSRQSPLSAQEVDERIKKLVRCKNMMLNFVSMKTAKKILKPLFA